MGDDGSARLEAIADRTLEHVPERLAVGDIGGPLIRVGWVPIPDLTESVGLELQVVPRTHEGDATKK
jgi:hypothetical protein